MKMSWSVWAAGLLSLGAVCFGQKITKIEGGTYPGMPDARVVKVEIELPSEGMWEIKNYLLYSASHGMLNLYPTVETEEAMEDFDRQERWKGRGEQITQERELQLKGLYQRAMQYTRWRDEGQTVGKWVDRRGVDDELFGDFEVRFVEKTVLPKEGSDKKPALGYIAIEFEPRVADGKRLVLHNDGSVKRIAFGPNTKDIVGVSLREAHELGERPDVFPYVFHTHIKGPKATSLSFTATNAKTGQELPITIDLEKWDAKTELDEEFAEEWGYNLDWFFPSSFRISRIVAPTPGLSIFEPEHNEVSPPTTMRLFGGGLAIEETLHMESLRVAGENDAERTIPIEDVKGVTVKAHEYAELLGDAEVGTLEFATYVPRDRFFLYAPDAADLIKAVDQGGELMHRFQVMFSKRGEEKRMLESHLARLGMTVEAMRKIIASGAVSDVAVILPDLFLSEGTDPTILARIRKPQAADSSVLGMMTKLRVEGVGSFPVPAGGNTYFAIHNDLFILGSQKSEVETVFANVKNPPATSLGHSAEFKYMLSQQPMTENTKILVYMSDPFIRRLTGPEMKIGQYRRMQARALLEHWSAASLKSKFFSGKAITDSKALVERGYAKEEWLKQAAGLTWDQGVPTLPSWGRASRMATLLDHPVTRVTEAERKAYSDYEEAYSDRWGKFFDPIAIRVDQEAEKRWVMDLFVLPLIDASIYDGISL